MNDLTCNITIHEPSDVCIWYTDPCTFSTAHPPRHLFMHCITHCQCICHEAPTGKSTTLTRPSSVSDDQESTKGPSTPATMSKQQATLSKQRSTLSKQHSTLLPKSATMSNDSVVKFRPFGFACERSIDTVGHVIIPRISEMATSQRDSDARACLLACLSLKHVPAEA